jgi:hypothetical protein
MVPELNPLLEALRQLIIAGIDFLRALLNVIVQFFYLIIKLVQGALSLFS